MSESVRTIISEQFISFLLSTGEDYTCCVLPRYDAYLFSQAIKESVQKECSVNFETNSMSVDILNLGGTFIIDCTQKHSGDSFQITCLNGEGIAEEVEKASLKAKEVYGVPTEKVSKWAIFKALANPA